MGRPPCCDKMGVKKGPWTPEEDIMLVSYVQEHGPGNWRAVPTNTGMLHVTCYMFPKFLIHMSSVSYLLYVILNNSKCLLRSLQLVNQ